MKKRVRRVVNFFAFNLLFFALYLNFIHNDNAVAAPANSVAPLVDANHHSTALVKKEDNAKVTTTTTEISVK